MLRGRTLCDIKSSYTEPCASVTLATRAIYASLLEDASVRDMETQNLVKCLNLIVLPVGVMYLLSQEDEHRGCPYEGDHAKPVI
jgi:hypothetical protein